MSENKYNKIRRDLENEKMRQELKERYKEDWKFCKQVLPPSNNITEYLGDLDADDEWSNDKEGAYKKFLNIGAYKSFTEESNLILMGRTGTGKSSILNRYAYAINHGEIQGFSIVISIKFERFFDVLQNYAFSDDYDPNRYIQDGIDLIVKLCVMNNLIRVLGEDPSCVTEMQQLSRYLKSKKITRYTEIVSTLSDEIDYKNKPNNSIRDVILELKKAYKDINEEQIEGAMASVLERHRVLVLADSVDYYDITERKVVIINKALVEVVFKYYNSRKEKGILLKAAIPSEIYTHIIEQIPAKRKTKVVAIEWRYKDIIKMLALKIFYFFNKQKYEYVKDILGSYQLEDFYNYDIAIDLLHKMLPKTCRACIPLDFETLPYCIRHTQKKPRQIVTVFNIFVDKICQENQFDYFIRNSNEISNYIHEAQKDIINDALNMYNAIAKEKVLPIVKSVLDKKRNLLEMSDLNSAIKEALSIIGSIGLTEDEIKQILIESGMVGQLLEEHYVKENSTQFNNNNVLKICIALFEYQIKDTLPIVKKGIYVLHPMCYEYYTNEIDHNALVYPSSADDIDDNVISKLEKEGVIY